VFVFLFEDGTRYNAKMSRGSRKEQAQARWVLPVSIIGIGVMGCASFYLTSSGIALAFLHTQPVTYDRSLSASTTFPAISTEAATPPPASLNIAAYEKKLLQIANYPVISTSTASSTSISTSTLAKRLWPAKNAPLPLAGALLPFNRIVAYYGNFYSSAMGVLGEYPEQEVLQKLASTTEEWQEADPSTPVVPAIDYIVVTAQGSKGSDGKYRLRMPDDQVDKALDMANQVHGLLFLDVQVGLSNVQTEVPLLEKYLEMPNVELSLDPEFAMQTSGMPPGTVIGTLDAKDIDFAAHYLANLVTKDNLPPKILVVHRFTEDMVTHYQNITPLPQVQIVMDMDGWGFPAKKINTYNQVIASEPVQFTGFKLFYKADLQAPAHRLLTPAEVLQLTPEPSYIQYQ